MQKIIKHWCFILWYLFKCISFMLLPHSSLFF